jgi:sugar/nucleoside kinase (ribokinase family)
MREPTIDIVHVGSACRDLTDDDERGWRLGGGASYSALTTARLGLRTAAVIGVDEPASTALELDLLRDAGVELLLVGLAEGPMFRNQETPAGRIQWWPVHGQPLPVPGLPPAWWSARAWSLVPVASELNEAWAAAIPHGAFADLAWQGLLRRQGPTGLTEQLPPTPSALLDIASVVGVSRQELPADVPAAAIARALRPGTRLAMTDGYHGGDLVTVLADHTVHSERWAAVRPDRVVDPTGAGDVFLAALVAAMVRPDLTLGASTRTVEAVEFAATAASFVVEAPGLLGVPERAAVLDRLDRAVA